MLEGEYQEVLRDYKESILEALEKEAEEAERKYNETNKVEDFNYWRGIWRAISIVEGI